jgi:tol-pal system protein YbgF
VTGLGPARRLLAPVLAVSALAAGCVTATGSPEIGAEAARLRQETERLRSVAEQGERERASLATRIDAADATLAELRTRLEQSTEEVGQLQARLRAAEEGLRQARTRNMTVVAMPPPPSHPVPPPARAADQLYADGLRAFQTRERGQAVLEFRSFVRAYPQHSMVPLAHYWIGEAYFLDADYRGALAGFQSVVEVGAANPRAAEALVKIGLCHARLGEPVRARQAWERAMREYPDDDAAGRALALLLRRSSSRSR